MSRGCSLNTTRKLLSFNFQGITFIKELRAANVDSKVLYKAYLLNAILFELMLGPAPVLSLLISLLSLIKILLSLLSKILPSFLPTKSAILTLPRVSGCSPWCALAVSSQFSQRRVRPRLRGSELWIRQGGKSGQK